MSKAISYYDWEKVQLVIIIGVAFDINNLIDKKVNFEINNQYDYHKINNTEKTFKKFCDKRGIIAVFLHQSPNSFSKIISQNGAKRPDFRIASLFGDFYVDVKTSRLNKYTKYTIDIKDLEKLKISQDILRRPIYLAYPTDPWYKGKDWGFISINKVCKLKKDQDALIQKGYNFVGIKYKFLKRYNNLI